jgi:CubicO group peptidase (beta-lactamase class C family)
MSEAKGIPLSKKSLAVSLTIMLTLVLLLSIVAPALAQQDRGTSDRIGPTAPSPVSGPTDPAEMESFLDNLYAQQMEEHNVAGAAISVVKDGKLFFAKGYGYADLENNIPVDPEKTLFKVGSVTKLFTWTAVMQLVEQGKLDLDADINTYLDFHIPDTYPQPITFRHLMTHTAGFEDLYFEVLAPEGESQVPPGEWLASHIPGRVRPPGDSPAYSNYGAALAGYIVTQVSRESYSQYVQAHILNPLGMENSTAEWPTPHELSAHESIGYMYDDGAFLVFPRLLGQAAFFPTGVIRSTVTDMARFMIAHLQDGRYSDANIPETRILKEATAQQMHSALYTPDPRILGSAYGFFDFSDNGQRVIGHGGEAEPMHSLLLLLPDENLGIFVSYNSTGGAALATQHFGFQRAFFDHYYPASVVEPIQPPADFTERIGRFTGSYRFTRSSYTTLEKFSGFFGAVELVSSGDGALLLATPWAKLRLIEVEPLHFRQADGPFEFVFREDDQGQITHMFTGLIPQFALEKLKWYETPGFNIAWLQGCVLIFLSVIPVALIRAIRNRRLSSDQKSVSRGARVAHWIILGISVLNLLFVLGTLQWLNTFQTYGVSLGVPMFYQIVLGLGVLSAVLTAGALVTIAAVAFVWFLNYWNLLGWRY